MSELSDKANGATRLEAARRKAKELQALQEEVARELAEAEAQEALEKSRRAAEKERLAKESLHRVTEKQRLREQERRAAAGRQARVDVPTEREVVAAIAEEGGLEGTEFEGTEFEGTEFEDTEFEDDGYVEVPVDEFHAETGQRRKRIGLKCFDCNRMEGHYLMFYRRLWYSYLVGLTFGLAIVLGPYRCQCCGSSRFMLSNLLHPKYYLSLFSTRSKSSKKSRTSRR